MKKTLEELKAELEAKGADLDKLLAQKSYCERQGVPYFAPFDGVCSFCGKQIYNATGVSLKQATDELITGCPHCHHTYVD